MRQMFHQHRARRDAAHGALLGKTVQVGSMAVRVEALVGQGGYSEIYRVSDAAGRPYALKHLRLAGEPEHIADVQREAKTMIKLRGHPNILTLHAAAFAGPRGAETDGFLLVDHCPDTLLGVMQRAAFALDERTVVDVFSCVAAGIAHMHRQSPPLAHRDLKAENVLLLANGSWVICDFGSTTSRAKVYSTPEEVAAEEEVIRRHTTPAYRAPEMWDLGLQRQLVDSKVDVWAMGVLLFVLAFGRLPFQGQDVKLAVMYGRYDTPPGRSPALRALVADLLTVDPAARPDVEEVLRRLEPLRAAVGIAPAAVPGALPAPPPPLPAVVLAAAQQQQPQRQQAPPPPQAAAQQVGTPKAAAIAASAAAAVSSPVQRPAQPGPAVSPLAPPPAAAAVAAAPVVAAAAGPALRSIDSSGSSAAAPTRAGSTAADSGHHGWADFGDAAATAAATTSQQPAAAPPAPAAPAKSPAADHHPHPRRPAPAVPAAAAPAAVVLAARPEATAGSADSMPNGRAAPHEAARSGSGRSSGAAGGGGGGGAAAAPAGPDAAAFDMLRDLVAREVGSLSSRVTALADANQALVLRVKQLEGYVVQQKDAIRGLQAQVAALQQQQQQHQQLHLQQHHLPHQPPGVGRTDSVRSRGSVKSAVDSYPVNVTPGSSPERSGGGAVPTLAAAAAAAGGVAATAADQGTSKLRPGVAGSSLDGGSGGVGSGGGGGSSGGGGGSKEPAGGKFWAMQGGA